MSKTEFMYKGKTIVIDDDAHPDATVSVDGRVFACHHHHTEGGLAMWMCNEAYFASPDLKGLARHFADYGYLFDAPGRVVVNDQGAVVPPHGDGEHEGPHGGHSAGRRRR